MLFSILEMIFGSGHSEITYQISRGTALLLSSNSDDMENLYKRMKKLYGERSQYVHSGTKIKIECLYELRDIVRRVLIVLIDLEYHKQGASFKDLQREIMLGGFQTSLEKRNTVCKDAKVPKNKDEVTTLKYFTPEQSLMFPLLKQYKREYNLYRLSIGTAWRGNDNVFIQWDGQLMGFSTPYQSFVRHMKRYNAWVQEDPARAKQQGFEELPMIPLHGLRHSCATLLNYLNVNIIDISKILGHAKSSTTMDIYAHSFEGQSRVAANRLDEYLHSNLRKLA